MTHVYFPETDSVIIYLVREDTFFGDKNLEK